MALSVPRAALFAVVPAELLITMSILSGSLTPTPAEMLAAVIVAPFTVWESLIGYQLFTQARSAGAGRWTALRMAASSLVPLFRRRPERRPETPDGLSHAACGDIFAA
ncbi:hypothetical protein [Nonomuraea sp. NEAU-A123]|uniref:hypothetical protein n=1 Tax=Nonomuraea sp. NEAU-A123 TaxID=2839649 RepID=UPI001BE4A1F0|nr:hypothetical protein [Nonomuraea sp. NEAU-A123]MBT2225132.1 hypothetical protein [Nonomuraea sp. NEAU-A123]